MVQQKMQMPGVFGGLMRYDDEYQSKFMISPTAVVGFVVAIIILVLILKLLVPVGNTVPLNNPVNQGGTPAPAPAPAQSPAPGAGGDAMGGHGGFIIPLILSNFS